MSTTTRLRAAQVHDDGRIVLFDESSRVRFTLVLSAHSPEDEFLLPAAREVLTRAVNDGPRIEAVVATPVRDT